MKEQTPKPIAVLISDVHFNLQTLGLASAALLQGVVKANTLGVPLIVAGDLHDTKANLRAECVNAMIETFKLAKEKPYVIIGNHDRINEKSPAHSINFLAQHATLVEGRYYDSSLQLYLFAYHECGAAARAAFAAVPKGGLIICHQGIEGSNMGTYIQDKSAIRPEDVAGRRVISGHYHARQTIQLPDGGTWDYIGNPFSLGFGEANDPEKGYQILMDNGSLTFAPTNLRRHHIISASVHSMASVSPELRSGDVLWVKLSGSAEQLSKITRSSVADKLGLTQPFRLDLIPDETETTQIEHNPTQSGPEILDALIDSLTNTSDDQKERLKSLWKGMT